MYYYVLRVTNLVAIPTMYIVIFVKILLKSREKRHSPLTFLQHWSHRDTVFSVFLLWGCKYFLVLLLKILRIHTFSSTTYIIGHIN